MDFGLMAAALCVFVSSAVQQSCLPRKEASIEALSERVTLTELQERWLRESFSLGRIRHPDDLWACPESTESLVEYLRRSLCWERISKVQTEAAWSTSHSHREQRIHLQTNQQWAAFRYKERDSLRRVVGGVSLQRGWLAVKAGALRGHWGFGLLSATPGTQSRGRGPLHLSLGGWRVSTSELSEKGLYSGIQGSKLNLWVFSKGQAWSEAGILVPYEDRVVGVLFRQERKDRGLSVLFRGRKLSNSVGLEVAYTSLGGLSLAASGKVRHAPWRFEASMLRTQNTPHVPRDDLRWAAKYAGTGGSVRGGLGVRRDLSSDLKIKSYGEIEVVWKASRGWRLTSLWRREKSTDLTPRNDLMRVVRYNLDWRRKPWSVTARMDERVTPEGESTMATLKGGRDWPAVKLRFRARDRAAQGKDPGMVGYRRRPGALFDLERVPVGRQWGVWVEARWKSSRWEISGDVREGDWEAALAFHFSWERID